MTRQRVILVGVDGSDAGMRAVEWAAAEARTCGWGLHLVCAYSLPSFAASTMDGGFAVIDESRVRASAEEVLDAAEARLGDGLTVKRSVETGDPTTVLAELSRNASLVVIGKRKGGGLADRILGAVSSALPPHAHCPTVVVPFSSEEESHVPVKRIVAGMDGSDSARIALVRAIEEAVRWGAALTVVSGVPLATGGAALSWGLAPMDPDQLVDDVQRGLDEIVDTTLADVGEEALRLRVQRHALGGSGAALMVEFSTAVDLVVVGTRGRGGFAGLLLGSTSQTVIQHSSCPVLVVPTETEKSSLGGPYPWQRRR
ncbi:MAG TPA: universal stress protein [Actinomycetaceae bacterium]|nr:universal stress protein [Actinomycetaceae bacterium]